MCIYIYIYIRTLPPRVSDVFRFESPLRPSDDKLTKYSISIDHFLFYICLMSVESQFNHYPVGWDSRMHRQVLCIGVRPYTRSVLGMALNNLVTRFQYCWGFGKCRVPLYCHRFQVHSILEWSASGPIYGSNRIKLWNYSKRNCLK